MRDEEYLKKYDTKTPKQLCNMWRKNWIKEMQKYDDQITINKIKQIKDEDIIKYGIALLIEEIKNETKSSYIQTHKRL